jgi:hypothetical protein
MALHNRENVACLRCSKIKSSKAKYSGMCTKNLTDGAFCFHRHRHSSAMRTLSTDNDDGYMSKEEAIVIFVHLISTYYGDLGRNCQVSDVFFVQ